MPASEWRRGQRADIEKEGRGGKGFIIKQSGIKLDENSENTREEGGEDKMKGNQIISKSGCN